MKKSSKREWGVILDRYHVFWTTFQPSPPTNHFTVFFLTIWKETENFVYIFARENLLCNFRLFAILLNTYSRKFVDYNKKPILTVNMQEERNSYLKLTKLVGGGGGLKYTAQAIYFLKWSICLQHVLFAKCESWTLYRFIVLEIE